MKSKSAKKNHIPAITIFIVFFVFLAVFVGILSGKLGLRTEPSFYPDSNKYNFEDRKNLESIDIPTDAPSFYGEIYSNLNSERKYMVSPMGLEAGESWWISDDGWSIIVPTKFVITAKVRPTGATPNEKVMTNLNNLVSKIMQKNGYILNTTNSSLNEKDTKFYDYVQAYQKDDEKCLATSSPDVGSESEGTEFYSKFTFGCFSSQDFQEAYNAQIPFLKGLNDRNAVIRNIKVNGDRASMAIGWRRTGASARMYKSGEDWKKIIVAQGVPECKELEDNNVPKEFWVDCFDAGGTIIKGNSGL